MHFKGFSLLRNKNNKKNKKKNKKKKISQSLFIYLINFILESLHCSTVFRSFMFYVPLCLQCLCTSGSSVVTCLGFVINN